MQNKDIKKNGTNETSNERNEKLAETSMKL